MSPFVIVGWIFRALYGVNHLRRCAAIETAFRNEEVFVRRGLEAEVRKMKEFRKQLSSLRGEAALMLRENPWASKAVRELLLERTSGMLNAARGERVYKEPVSQTVAGQEVGTAA